MMRYRSSIVLFTKGLTTEAALNSSTYVQDISKRIRKSEAGFRSAVEECLRDDTRPYFKNLLKAIPQDDLSEIIDYISRYHEAYGFRPVAPGAPEGADLRLFPWLASIAVCALDDIGR